MTVATTRKRSYAGYVLLVDGINIVTTPLVVGLLGYVVAAPIVHLVQRRPSHALGSFGLRLGLAIGGAAFGQSAVVGNKNGAAMGFLVGALHAMILDASLLCRESVVTEPASTTGRRALPFLPMAAVRSEGGFDVGVGAAF